MPTVRERLRRFRQILSRRNHTTPPITNENPPQLPLLPENEDSAIGPREHPVIQEPLQLPLLPENEDSAIGPREHPVIQEHPLQLAPALANRRAGSLVERREFVEGVTGLIQDLEASFHEMRRMMRLPIRMSHIDIRLFYAAMLDRHAAFADRIDGIIADYQANLNIEGHETQQRNPLETVGNRPETRPRPRPRPEPQSESEPGPQPVPAPTGRLFSALEPGQRVTVLLHLPPNLGWGAFAGILETMARDFEGNLI